ncbi:hypothetical protein PRZ48_011786 [Zasmidium cellare]|uniref:Uncharacterized protein n=1 Tax=Zasmidium cellare TaxID=395010 RepID=A0ABR0E7W6_ZASCE|nr:hypothetical protein PRZ48_011786 [Zasmidium cellare]
MPPIPQSAPTIPELHLPPPILLPPNPFGNMSRRTRRDSLTDTRQRPIIVTHPARDGWHERQEDLIKVHRELIAQYEELREKIRAANIRLGLEVRSQGDENVRAHEAPEA